MNLETKLSELQRKQQLVRLCDLSATSLVSITFCISTKN